MKALGKIDQLLLIKISESENVLKCGVNGKKKIIKANQ